MQLNMKRVLGLLTLASVLVFSSYACKKKCELPPETNSGVVVANSLVKEQYTTSSKVVRKQVSSGERYKVSLDQGVSYADIDFNNFYLLCYPMDISCHSTVDRNVTVEHGKKLVTYFITITTCPGCEDLYTVPNWVMVPRFPDDYQVIFRRKFVEKI
jgi:hypothetical protein